MTCCYGCAWTGPDELQVPVGRAGASPWRPPKVAISGALRLIPSPSRWTPDGGSTEITSIATAHTNLLSVHRLAERTGLGPFVSDAGLKTDIRDLPASETAAYRLAAAQQQIEISAAGPSGVFYAGIWLLNMIHTCAGKLLTGVIKDRPPFSWRGQHLDCARNFMSASNPAQVARPDGVVETQPFVLEFRR